MTQTAPAGHVQEEIDRLGPWFHNLHLPGGVQTCPGHFLGDFPAFKWKQVQRALPEDLSGWNCLDIGCNAGYYSFQLAHRGARVLGIDLDERYLRQAQWAARQFGLQGQTQFRQMQVYDLAREAEKYDLVLFLGVFYHLRYPLLALDIVAQRVKRLMLFQTLSIPGEAVLGETFDRPLNERDDLLAPGWPKMAFIEHRFGGDPTNWWIANHAGIEALLRSAGLEVAARPAHEFYLCRPDPRQPSCVATWNRSEYLSATGTQEAAPGGAP